MCRLEGGKTGRKSRCLIYAHTLHNIKILAIQLLQRIYGGLKVVLWFHLIYKFESRFG